MNSSVTVATVESKTSAKSQKAYLLFTDSTGKKWTFWNGQDKAWGLIKPGAQFDIEWERDGQYQNIKGMVFKGEVPPPPLPEPAINHEKQESIESQNALDNLTQLMEAKMLTLEYIDAMSPLEGALVSTLMTRAGINLAFAEKREPIPANQLRAPRNPVG